MVSLPRPILLAGLLFAAAAASLGSAFQTATSSAERRHAPSILSSTSKSWRSATASRPRHALAAKNSGDDDMGSVDEYRNGVTEFLSNFMQKPDTTDAVDPLADIDFNAPKVPKLPLETLAAALDAELYAKEWFVTGNVNPIYFDDGFQFQDPDVKLTGIEDYARGVLKLFDQETSRAEIISCLVNTTTPNTITVTWRLSGRVNIGPQGLPIKPYICYTDFTIDESSGLVVFQEDRFDVPGWDILLSALFPFLIGTVTKAPAPEVPPRTVEMPALPGAKGKSLFDGVLRQLGI